jgi:hypothetical protein
MTGYGHASGRAIGMGLLDTPATPLVFNASIDTTNMTNVVLIDSTLSDKRVFYDSANAKTFPIIYDYNSKTDDLLALFRQKFPASSIQRISLVFHDRGTNYMADFMNNKPLFQESDLAEGQTSFSDNMSFLISCMKEFHVSHIDFLACNTLQYSNWKSYYALLASKTSVVVGASNDKTGNLNYGGDWVMENTHENVRDLYFNANISNYASTLAAITISANGASQAIYLQMNGLIMEYSIGTLSAPGSYVPIASTDWPVTFTNSTPTPDDSSILRVVFTQDLTISSTYGDVLGYFIAGTTYITFDGSNNFINITNILLYPGFIKNGSSAINGNRNVIVQNIKTNVTGGSLNGVGAGSRAGWICAGSFGRGAFANQIINCTNNGAIATNLCGGICGDRVGAFGGSVTITNCTNSGTISSLLGSGGIVGSTAGFTGGAVSFVNCTNAGVISGENAGGLAGSTAGLSNGSVTFTGCTNTGVIGGISAGGIVGYGAGLNSISTIITNCANSGTISGQYAGGIAGAAFGYNNQNSTIINSYSTGNITGNNAGGIVGSLVGFTDSLNPSNVNITNSYSLGAISTTAGGICGGTDGTTYSVNPNITITNCYSYGTIVDANSGIVAIGLLIPITKTNTYVANNNWSDASANALIALTGTPTNINTNNPGTTWTMITAGTPYVLSAYNAALYSPSSASATNTYTSAQGLFQPGYTYRLLYTSQTGNVATARVFASKGTAPYYNSYNSNTFIITNASGSFDLITSLITSSTGVLNFTLPDTPPPPPPEEYPCFLEGTKILCFENNQPVYRSVETLRKGDLVKTIYNGYMPVYMMGTTSIYNPGNDYRVTNRLYKCPKEKYPTLFEDLYITGCHSILVPEMTDDQWENTKAVNGNIYVTDNHFRLIACADEKAEPFNKEGFMNIYHIALEHHEIYMNYGIYANGLLVESCSIDYLIKYSNLKIMGEDTNIVSQDAGKVLSRQLVDTY